MTSGCNSITQLSPDKAPDKSTRHPRAEAILPRTKECLDSAPHKERTRQPQISSSSSPLINRLCFQRSLCEIRGAHGVQSMESTPYRWRLPRVGESTHHLVFREVSISCLLKLRRRPFLSCLFLLRSFIQCSDHGPLSPASLSLAIHSRHLFPSGARSFVEYSA